MVRVANSLVLPILKNPLIKQLPSVNLSALFIAKICLLFHFVNLNMVWRTETRVLFKTKGYVLGLEEWDLEKYIFSRHLTSLFKKSIHKLEKPDVHKSKRLWIAEICYLITVSSLVTTKKSSNRGCALWADAIGVAIDGLLFF